MKKILVLEDEASIRSFIVINLRRAGYDVIEAETGEEALERLRANPDTKVALLDIMLPGIDGFEVCRRIRATNTKIGIIMLTARGDERDELQGFQLGVDEYISKPFSPKILVARVEAILRRTNAISSDSVITAGILSLDKAAHQVKVDGREVELSFKEFELLSYFMENQGIALSREKILNSVWNYDYFGDARTIDTHVKKLRSKLGKNADYIKTIWGMGYKFEVDEP